MIRSAVSRVVVKKAAAFAVGPTSKGGEMHDHRDDPELGTVTLPAAPDVWDPATTRKGFLTGAAVPGLGATSLGALAPAALPRATHGQARPTRPELSIRVGGQCGQGRARPTSQNTHKPAPL